MAGFDSVIVQNVDDLIKGVNVAERLHELMYSLRSRRASRKAFMQVS
jgi:hypothetical protein